jgi:hypothetical protein
MLMCDGLTPVSILEQALMSKRALKEEIRLLETRHANLVEVTAQVRAKTAAVLNVQNTRARLASRGAVPSGMRPALSTAATAA